VTDKRKLFWIRLVYGAFLVWLSLDIQGSIKETAASFSETGHWSGWPVIGGLSALELTFWAYIVLFILCIFLMGGLLVRILSFVTVVLGLTSFGVFGFNSWVTHALVLLGALVIMVRGGGAGTMDSALGAMQRRSLEREAEREAVRQAEKSLKEQDASGANA